MSALSTTTDERVAAPVSRQRFGTLVHVELRKQTDTRSGRGVLALILFACLGALVWGVTHADIPATFHKYSEPVATTVAFLAPVIAILAMTSEWTQRTALTTFTLSPRRLRVIAAKFTAAIALSCAVMVVVLVLTGGAAALGGLVHGHGHNPRVVDMGVEIRSYFIVMVLQVIMATAFGALAGQTAVALGAYFVAPTVWGAVGDQIFGGAAKWFDIFSAYGQLSSDRPFDLLGPTLTSVGVWVVLPVTLGIIRCVRREVK